jgi:hypothetical protein
MIWREQKHANCREIKSSRELIHSSMLVVVAGAAMGIRPAMPWGMQTTRLPLQLLRPR